MQRQLIESERQRRPVNVEEVVLPGPDSETTPEMPATRDTEFFTRLAFQDSPQKGCELLFRRYHQALCSHAVRYVYSKETAEDLVSEVFCKFWKTKAYENITSSYRYYLFRSVRNEAFNYLRLEFHKLEDIETALIQEASFCQRPDQIMQFEEVLHTVEDLVERLPPQCRKVFLLSRFEGKKYQDIATELGLSIKTVEVHIVKALSIVRKGLKDHWLTAVGMIGYVFAG
ncbi:RNA polymerase sigma-70 factor [Spirosoma utsteinense]|uniref:RNA polymerase sigma-70 factor (ECF subfamily) n=1 Tax=Spirosoma utsteinense TaxID=2585773 RepID=A0ABR6WA14_9BACT|nr:RNA polymerase sigma-70 factor [Spirosoma utsteinense]MBC3787009.1 RNA polymerase sigma-70 factor (ECF subfamily) [Spirosoma utsteinense]MBC3793410.1 RNA polymerase sigma-70 factor (ECF subfamily) [Spirosoma utsteinense]